MNYPDFISVISKKLKLRENQARKNVEILNKIITQQLLLGKPVKISNFGNFVLLDYPSKKITDSRDRTKFISIPEHKVLKFRPGNAFQYSIKSNGVTNTPVAIKPATKNSDVIHQLYIPYIDLTKLKVSKNILDLIPEQIARRYNVVPIEKKGNVLVVAMTDPQNQDILEFLKKTTGMLIETKFCTQDDLINVFNQYTGIQKELDALVGDEEEIIKAIKPTKSKIVKDEEISENAPAAKIVSSLIRRAVRDRASDIHIEPQDESVIVRFRVDGVLRKVLTLPKEMQLSIISRIKILSNLKIDESRIPQDGRFQSIVDQNEIDFRVSTYTTINGEKTVLRILSQSTGIIPLEKLGFHPNVYKILDENIHKAHGMILVTGPTGSGKTTTLYSIISKIFDVGVNIVTLEDPVEYRIDGINQGQINPDIGFTFANGLRSILRQDPDVIMLGEIRDYETASMAIHAALTGHVLLSTLHTNNASGAIPRFIDMKIEPFLVSSTVNAIIAQRLCRKICESCKEKIKPSKDQISEIKIQLNSLTKSYQNSIPKKISLFHGKGCDACQNTGYKGRLGIYEVLEINAGLKNSILEKISSEEIQNAAIKNGMLTLKQDGILKALNGETTLEEVWRTTKD